MKLFYPIIFTKEDKGYSTLAPDLEGCFSEGEDFNLAYENTQNAIGLYLDGLSSYPKSSNPEAVTQELTHNQFICVVEFDDIAYKKRNSSRSVKKTLTIPEWLNNEAEKNHINFSGVLQEALKSRLNI